MLLCYLPPRDYGFNAARRPLGQHLTHNPSGEGSIIYQKTAKNFSDLDTETQKSSDVQVEIIPPSHVHVTRPNLSCAKKKQIARATTAAFISDLESENLGSSNSTVVQVTPLK